MQEQSPYQPINKIRIVTAASLFDGHDAAINIMRRIIQSTGCEVIHLGHDRSVEEVVNCAIQEDANAIAMTSYQGGHNEYLKYMFDLLNERGAGHIKIFAGGGGTILPEEIKELHAYGIDRIYHPDDGRAMGLQGMINDLVQKADFPTGRDVSACIDDLSNFQNIARLISAAENFPQEYEKELSALRKRALQSTSPILGITGTGGAGKSSLVDELVRRFLMDFPDKKLGIISVDPSKRKTGGALLGDRIRMNAIKNNRVYMRSLATRQANLALSAHVGKAIDILKAANFDLIILETSGIGQSDTEILEHSDASMYVMTPDYGAATQLEKIDMLDFADLIAVNKFDKRGALDALRDVKKQYQRNHKLFDLAIDDMPVYGTIASQFNDPGVNRLYVALMKTVVEKTAAPLNSTFEISKEMSEKVFVIPPKRNRYLSEIADSNRQYNQWAEQQKQVAEELYAIDKTIQSVKSSNGSSKSDDLLPSLKALYSEKELNLDPKNRLLIDQWQSIKDDYNSEQYTFKVRNKELRIKTSTLSLSNTRIPKVSLPNYSSWGDVLHWRLQENLPGHFPYTAGIFLLNERVKTLLECLQVKVALSEPTNVSTT